jgi:membrane protein YdbS with pleckstrin-like domain
MRSSAWPRPTIDPDQRVTGNLTPDRFEIEIDRAGLLRYMRLQGLTTWLPIFVFFGGFFGFVACLDTLKHLQQTGEASLETSAILIASRVGIGLAIGAAIGLVVYLLFVHRGSRRAAQALTLRVDGMFLQVIQDGIAREDRKIHFNKISDYAVVDGPLMRRCGIRGLSISCATPRANGTIFIAGIVDAERIRDLLCTIDREREDRVS